MLTPNMNYAKTEDSYFFYNISRRIEKYNAENPDKKLYRMGVGDAAFPLTAPVIDAMHRAVEEQGNPDTFRGYMPECGTLFLREAIVGHYAKRGVSLSLNEVFVSSGASDDLGGILELFDASNSVLVTDPTYPAYVDANVMHGRKIIRMSSCERNSFTPIPDEETNADIIYICSPNNPTGAVYDRDALEAWVSFANSTGAVILFDAAYEAFIEEELPHSIFEIPGARTCAIEICSLSKTAGFTGVRCGYTVIPKNLCRNGMNINDMWVRNRTTVTNGVSYIVQRAAQAVFSDEGQRQIRRNIRLYKRNAECLMRALDKCGLIYSGGKNAPYIWLRCPNGMTGWELFDYLLQEIQVIGTPGEGFGLCGNGYFRLSALGNPADTQEAARRIMGLFPKRARAINTIQTFNPPIDIDKLKTSAKQPHPNSTGK